MAPGIAFAPRKSVQVQNGNVLKELNLIAGKAIVQGKITDAANTPQKNVPVRIRIDGIDGIQSVLTDDAGNYQFRGVSGDKLNMIVVPASLRIASSQTTLSNAAPQIVNFKLEAGGGFHGFVRDAVTGAALKQATISVLMPAISADSPTLLSNANGGYSFKNLPPGPFDVVVAASGYQAAVQRITVENGVMGGLDFSLDKSKILVKGKVVGPQGAGVSQALVEAVDAKNVVLAAGFSGKDGQFELDTLLPGTYRIRVVGEGFSESTSQDLQVANGQTVSNVVLNVAPTVIGVDTSHFSDEPLPPPPAPSPRGLINGFLNLIEHLPRPKRLTEEAKLPALQTPTCKAVIEAHRELAAYIRLREAMFRVWEENYATGNDIKVTNQQVVGLQLAKLSGSAASLFINAATAANNVRRILADPSLSETVLTAIKGLADRYDAYFFSFKQLIDANNQALANGTPPPGFKDQMLAIVKAMKQLFDDIVLFVGSEESIWGKASPVAGALMSLYDVYSDFMTLQEDFDVALQQIKGIKNATEDAASLYAKADGVARSLQDTYEHELVTCEIRENEPRIDPKDLEPPGWPGGTSAGGSSTSVAVRTSFDPNNKSTTAGYGAKGHIQNQALAYLVEFENDPDAGATIPAQEVFVTDLLDTDLDLGTFEWIAFGFDNRKWDVPPGLSHYETTIDLRPDGISLLVPVILTLDVAKRELKATFRSLDPLTRKLPDALDAGFLPVNDKNLHNGEGFFSYRIEPLKNLATGTEITNQASIVFDVNDPILTPITKNTIDVGAPSSKVNALPTQSSKNIPLSWTGTDDEGGSGIAGYDIYVSDNGGAYQLFLKGTTQTSAVFVGELDHTYRFYSVATDNVGNRETAPTTPDAETTVKNMVWQNPINRVDVNGDGKVFPIDALMVINELNGRKYHDPITKRLVPRTDPNLPFYDVNGDGFMHPIDALIVINELNRRSGGEGESSFEAHSSLASTSDRSEIFLDSDWLESLFAHSSSHRKSRRA